MGAFGVGQRYNARLLGDLTTAFSSQVFTDRSVAFVSQFISLSGRCQGLFTPPNIVFPCPFFPKSGRFFERREGDKVEDGY
jgi:hypothetical protein